MNEPQNTILDYKERLCLGSFTRAQSDLGYSLMDRPGSFRPGNGCYCKVPLERIFDSNDFPGLPGWEYTDEILIHTCPRCGFWTKYTYDWLGDCSASMSYMEHKYEACLRKFEVSSIDVPVQILRDYLSKNETKVHLVEPKKFEVLVGSIFHDFLSCEVLHVGRSGDGGIDLIALDSELPTRYSGQKTC